MTTVNKGLFFIIAFGALLLSCSRQQKIDGSVFIVTEGAENIKLGLVTVALFDRKQITPDILKAATTLAQNNLDKFLEDYKRDEVQMRQLADATFAKGAAPGGDFIRLNRESHKIRDAWFTNECPARSKIFVNNTFKIYANNIGTPLVTSKTDADGKFSFSIPKGSYLLAATAERKVMGETEFYYWLNAVDFDEKRSKQVMLSNDNLINTKHFPVRFCFGNSTVELLDPLPVTGLYHDYVNLLGGLSVNQVIVLK